MGEIVIDVPRRSIVIRAFPKQTLIVAQKHPSCTKSFDFLQIKKTFQMDTSGPVMPFFGLVKY